MRLSRALPLPLTFALALLGRAAPASTVIVPDQYSTIQSALGSGADTVRVKDGDYDEAVVVSSPVALLPFVSSVPNTPLPFPSIRSLVAGADLVVRSFRVRGRAAIEGGQDLTFESCRLDSGLASAFVSILQMRGCLVFGSVRTPRGIALLDITDCTVIGGGIAASFESAGRIRGNYVEGPVPIGIELWSDSAPRVEGNTVVGATDGIVVHVHGGRSVEVVDNWVVECAGTAYRVLGDFDALARLADNHAWRCGGSGIEASGLEQFEFARNVVDSSGAEGIHVSIPDGAPGYAVSGNVVRVAGGAGIRIETDPTLASPPARVVSGNRVVAAGAEGIRVSRADTLLGNVVGRCAGAGVVADTGGAVVRSNTAYGNGGSGFLLHDVAAALVDHNIGAWNGRYGLEGTGPVTAGLSCDDWFLNALGPVHGIVPGATDQQVDPLFCDVARDSVGLRAGSPLVQAGFCGLVGALGVECADVAAVVLPPASRGVLRSAPQPSTGPVLLSWGRLSRPARLEVFDATGARRWHADLTAGTESLRWEGTDQDGRRLPTGVYFVRLTGSGQALAAESARGRVILVR